MINSQTAWEEIQNSLPIGTNVRGKVLRHAPFGIFVSLPGIPFDGLVQITDFKDTGRMTPKEYPALESTIDAVVLGFKDTGNQIWLGMKPSQICRVELKAEENASRTVLTNGSCQDDCAETKATPAS